MPFGNIIDKNIKSLWYLLWIFETRIAITIMRDQHQHHDWEEDITIMSNIEIIAQLYMIEWNIRILAMVEDLELTWS